uniref:Neuroblastoma-amplified sequence N-terminal domain-containing protein n=1 Tax=Timema shepardi TaxID=629360 RepID=A0A7R9B602_TIMSH|nr:unnamed protein product [Timema shepardi]
MEQSREGDKHRNIEWRNTNEGGQKEEITREINLRGKGGTSILGSPLESLDVEWVSRAEFTCAIRDQHEDICLNMVDEVDHSPMPQASDDCILYELLVYSEWKQDPELVVVLPAEVIASFGPVEPQSFPAGRGSSPEQSVSQQLRSVSCASWRVEKYSKSTDANILNVAATSYSIKHVLQYLGQRESILDEILRLLLRHIPWQFAVGESGKVVAILQDVQLEIRTSRDEYCTVVGKAVVPKDPYPQWRRLAWSPDCSMLAVSHSNGSVSFYDLLGSNLFNIYPPKFQQDVPCADSKQAQACIIFINSRIKSPKWSCELLLVNYHAELRAFLVSPTDGYQENHTFSFAQHHRQGIVAVAYHPSHHLLFLAGPSALFSASALKGLGSSMGLSAWRLLNDYPFYRLALSTDEEEALLLAHRSLWNWVPSFRRSRNHSVIFKMQVSPNGRLLACLHSCGSISVWHLPGIR